VAAAATGQYDAILMDCQMPIMDGFTATGAIREQESGDSRVPIIALTASALESDRQRCLAAGMDYHLAKPIRLEVLAHTLVLATDRDLGANATATPPIVGAEDDHPVAQRLRAVSGGNQQLTRELNDLYKRQTPERLDSLRTAAAEGDFDTLSSSAHTLKGTVANLGADEMADICRAIEEQARAHELADIDRLIADLETHAAELGRVLSDLARGA
jgi:CheY-like chemotaxis protein